MYTSRLSKVPGVVPRRKAGMTDAHSEKAIRLPFSFPVSSLQLCRPPHPHPHAPSDACPHLFFSSMFTILSNMQRRYRNFTSSGGEFAFALHFHFITCPCRSPEIHQLIQLDILISQKVNASCRPCL